jgi:hypothetical protein
LKAQSEDVEVKAIQRLLRLVKQTDMHLHFSARGWGKVLSNQPYF